MSEIDHQQSQTVDIAKIQHLIEHDNQVSRSRQYIGGALVVMSLGLGGAVAADEVPDFKVTLDVPFEQSSQDVLNSVDDGLAKTGAVVAPLALLMVGGAKLASSRSTWTRFIDAESSSEMSDTGPAQPRRYQRVLEATVAGSIPVLAAAGAGLATFSSSIGTEVTEGPSRAIEAFSDFAPGEAYVVQSEDTMPMKESWVSRELTASVQKEAAERGVQAAPFDLLLGDIQDNETTLSSLAIGIDTPQTSPLHWTMAEGCKSIPIAVDETADIAIGSAVKVNGTPAEVVMHSQDASAINRIAIAMDRQAMASCIKKVDAAPVHGVALESSVEVAADILDAVNTHDEVAAVISQDTYIDNSERFWMANVEPITNNLSLVAFGFAGAAMAGAMGARLFRNRREWSMNLANGQSMSTLRATEIMRATKDGLAATVLGVGAAAAATPLVGFTESGLQAGVGPKEAAVGAAVGILGPVGGTVLKVLRPERIVDKRDGTRV
ncbi:MAG TPA: hypothetical protein VK983_04680 [Candidatus Limnocylindrales bacterium]|nr:hypothetical protein [Candidatus Limnocylindrales bacterium]